MQNRRTTLILISLAIVLLTTGCLISLKEEVSSAPFAIAQQEVDLNQTAQPSSAIACSKTNFEYEAFAGISEILNTIPTGRETLSLIEKYDIDLRFESGGGSRFNPNTNQIIVDSSHELYLAALILIHEVTHASYLHEGTAAVVKADGRQEYVQKKVEEEMEAVVHSIEAIMEL